MIKITLLLLLPLLLFLGCNSSVYKDNRPILFSVGDSISIGYDPKLAQDAAYQYQLIRPNDNCRNSYYTLQNIDLWLSQLPKPPTLIVWNNGIWNTVVGYAGDPVQDQMTSVYDYTVQIQAIATKLKATGARVVFLTTTHIDPNTSVFTAGYEVQLNQAAQNVLPSMGVEVLDLNAFSLSLEADKVDPVHYNQDGFNKLGDFIAEYLQL